MYLCTYSSYSLTNLVQILRKVFVGNTRGSIVLKIVKVYLYRLRYIPKGCRRLRLPEFLCNRHRKAVRLSAVRCGSLYPQGSSLVLISLRVWVDSKYPVGSKELSPKKSQTLPREQNPESADLSGVVNQKRNPIFRPIMRFVKIGKLKYINDPKPPNKYNPYFSYAL
jgi:hypothetical protein